MSSQEIFRGRILRLRVDTVRLPTGRETTREIVEHPGAVVIVAIDHQGRVGMVRQYRSAIGRTTLEVPAGTREPNEDALSCAKRELGEEMGVTAGRWYPLVSFYSSPGFCTELLECFVAADVAPSAGTPEEDESIQRLWVDPSSIPSLIANHELCDAKSIASLLLYLQRDLTGTAPWRA